MSVRAWLISDFSNRSVHRAGDSGMMMSIQNIIGFQEAARRKQSVPQRCSNLNRLIVTAWSPPSTAAL